MKLSRIIWTIIILVLIWSCSSHVKFTSDDIKEVRDFTVKMYNNSVEYLDELEEQLNSQYYTPEAKEKSSTLLESSKEWLGTPYKFGGTSKNGVDCSGFVLNVYKDMGVELPRTSRQQYAFTSEVSNSNRKPGDLVFFRKGSRINHVGIYIGNNKLVHASTSKGVIIQDLDNSYLKQRFAGYRRVSHL